MNDRKKYVLALVAGMLTIPGLAFATNGALSNSDPDETTEVLGTLVTDAGENDLAAISAEDLVRACGVEGHYLVDLEAAGAIDDIQQAALNALRPICEEAGLPLPAAPIVEGETVVETVTVIGTAPGPVAGASSSTTSSSTSTTVLGTYEDDDAAEALEARAKAVTAIETAIEANGRAEKINEAIASVERGDAAYAAGDYDEAEEFYEEAEHKAIEAQLGHDHDEYDDHDEDDHHDDDHDEDDEDDDHDDDHDGYDD